MQEQNREVESRPLTQALSPIEDNGPLTMMFDSALFAQSWRACDMMSRSTIIPTHFQKNPSNVFIALQISRRLNLDPFMVMQKMYIVHGRPGFEAQFIIALLNSCGRFKGPIQWKMEGKEGSDDRAAIAYATRTTGEVCEARCDMKMAKAEGWYAKEGSKWKTIPELMLRYRSASFFARLHCPEVIMGMPAVDELRDMEAAQTIEAQAVEQAPEMPPFEAPLSNTDQVLDLLGGAAQVQKKVRVEDKTSTNGARK